MRARAEIEHERRATHLEIARCDREPSYTSVLTRRWLLRVLASLDEELAALDAAALQYSRVPRARGAA